MENYEELKQRIHSAQKAMDELLEFMEENPCGQDCRKCKKLKLFNFGTWMSGACFGICAFMVYAFVYFAISL